MYNTPTQIDIENVVKAYYDQVNISTNISLNIWQYDSAVNGDFSIEYILSTVNKDMNCKQHHFDSFVTLHKFVFDKIKRKEILFRKF